MVIVVDTKEPSAYPTRHVNAPPPYSAAQSPPSTPRPTFSRSSNGRALFQTLPPHVVLQIISACLPPIKSPQYVGTVYWITQSFRLVSRSAYIASMNVLRSTFLSDYCTNVKPPYTSDPFPLEPPEASLPQQFQRPQSVQSMHRETAVLDRFIVLKSNEDMRAYESELHLDLDHFKDIFELMQPKARMEDLVRKYGARAGVISIVPAPPLSPNDPLPTPLPFSAVSVSFSPRKVGVIVLRRTVVDVKRERDESLESVAKRLVKELARFLGRSR